MWAESVSRWSISELTFHSYPQLSNAHLPLYPERSHLYLLRCHEHQLHARSSTVWPFAAWICSQFITFRSLSVLNTVQASVLSSENRLLWNSGLLRSSWIKCRSAAAPAHRAQRRWVIRLWPEKPDQAGLRLPADEARVRNLEWSGLFWLPTLQAYPFSKAVFKELLLHIPHETNDHNECPN